MGQRSGQNAAANDQRAQVRRRVLIALACAILVMFAFTGALKFQRESQDAIFADADVQARTAADFAEQIDATIGHGWGVLAGAVELGSATDIIGKSPQAVANAAAKSKGMAGVTIFKADGKAVAQSNPAVNELALAAVAASRDEHTWDGVAVTRDGQRALALTRRTPSGVIVAVLDSATLLPDLRTNNVVLLVGPDGSVLARRPTGAEGANNETLAGALGLNPKGAIASRAVFIEKTIGGQRLAVASAPIGTGRLRLYTAAPATPEWQAVQPVALWYIAVFGVPFAAAFLLLRLWLKQSKRVDVVEAELIETKDRFRLAVDGAGAGVFEWRLDADRVELSPRVSELLRAPSNTMRADGFLALVLQEDHGAVAKAFETARETGVLETTFRVRGATGVSWIEIRGLAIEARGEPGSLRIVGTAIDVTSIRETEGRAKAMERRLREAIDSYSGPFALWDSRKRLAMFNRSYVKAYNLPPSLARAGAPYDAIHAAAHKEVKAARQDPSDPQIQEVELMTGVWLQMVERRTAEGGLVTVGADITALKRQEEALARSQKNLRSMVSQLEMSEGRNRELAKKYEEEKRRAEDASRAKSAFLANMSHELRTPLNAINGFSELMASELFGPLGDKRYIEYSRDILASGQLLLDLINDILDMAKIEAGKITLSPQALDPMEAIDQAVRLMRRRAEEKGLTLVVEGDAAPEIEADHRAVKQMLLNLISNAVKFTSKGGVMVRGRAAEGGVMISVIDTGVGIPKEHLPRLGRAFEQVDMALSRQNGGTGLGLALTKSLAEMHGGRLEIDSEEGRGTIVSIFLPARAAIAPEHMVMAGAA